MKRYSVIRTLVQAMKSSDIGIFIGEGICKEARPYRPDTDIYVKDDEEGLLSLAIGIASVTNKKVYAFCDSQYSNRMFSEFVQAGASKLQNLFLVLFVQDSYIEVPNTPMAVDKLNLTGTFYNMGLLVHDYTKTFRNEPNPSKIINNYFKWSKGPKAIKITVDRGSKKLPDIKFTSHEDIGKINSFIIGSNTGG